MIANKCYENTVYDIWQEMTSEDKRYAAEYLNETDENKENAVAEIKRWIEENDNLPTQINDFLILRFLRVGKFDLEKTKSRIENYYKQRSKLPEWYKNKNPFQPELQELLDLGIMLPLRKPDSQGRLVLIFRATLHNPSIHKMPFIAKINILAMEAAIQHYPLSSVYGCSMLIDTSNPTIRHIIQFKPYDIMNAVELWQNCYPVRYQRIVFFNTPVICSVLMRIFKSFMSNKLKSRFHVYSDAGNCFEDIPTNILPIEYGGTDGTLQELTEYWKKCIEDNCNLLTKDESD
ncbi:retinol-binding protein pinta isoform X1 [Monomorium pharaonis]|uniref:retinol-binding protein pinta isoform X1 n=1 Tax=Monomorium pharaonis TaxID=307658 RepID=UPI0017460DDB|nr:retinol-binding protein pinta isoform X1 [Monomorium pharaonis]XP_036143126.1 retinol-binding protein pinta isoform X1 [Monomorium pharaonis]XP_036143130.1 retinol-binding protein pinta isoform X1 [Monomorium pharaonis]XP_036143136.1 retinol-binding protein pinta isoform X1 [Monomorium pharaonis]